MPLYPFVNTKTGQTEDVLLGMNDPKVYLGPDGTDDPTLWKRVYTLPQASFDTKVDPHSAKDFVKVTNKRGVVGDLFDRSAELSAKRAEKEGTDPIKSKFYKRFSKKHGGKQHPQQRKEEVQKKLEGIGIKVDYGDV